MIVPLLRTLTGAFFKGCSSATILATPTAASGPVEAVDRKNKQHKVVRAWKGLGQTSENCDRNSRLSWSHFLQKKDLSGG